MFCWCMNILVYDSVLNTFPYAFQNSLNIIAVNIFFLSCSCLFLIKVFCLLDSVFLIVFIIWSIKLTERTCKRKMQTLFLHKVYLNE